MDQGHLGMGLLLSGALLLLVPAVIAAIVIGVVLHERRKSAEREAKDGR